MFEEETGTTHKGTSRFISGSLHEAYMSSIDVLRMNERVHDPGSDVKKAQSQRPGVVESGSVPDVMLACSSGVGTKRASWASPPGVRAERRRDVTAVVVPPEWCHSTFLSNPPVHRCRCQAPGAAVHVRWGWSQAAESECLGGPAQWLGFRLDGVSELLIPFSKS